MRPDCQKRILFWSKTSKFEACSGFLEAKNRTWSVAHTRIPDIRKSPPGISHIFYLWKFQNAVFYPSNFMKILCYRYYTSPLRAFVGVETVALTFIFSLSLFENMQLTNHFHLNFTFLNLYLKDTLLRPTCRASTLWRDLIKMFKRSLALLSEGNNTALVIAIISVTANDSITISF